MYLLLLQYNTMSLSGHSYTVDMQITLMPVSHTIYRYMMFRSCLLDPGLTMRPFKAMLHSGKTQGLRKSFMGPAHKSNTHPLINCRQRFCRTLQFSVCQSQHCQSVRLRLQISPWDQQSIILSMQKTITCFFSMCHNQQCVCVCYPYVVLC